MKEKKNEDLVPYLDLRCSQASYLRDDRKTLFVEYIRCFRTTDHGSARNHQAFLLKKKLTEPIMGSRVARAVRMIQLFLVTFISFIKFKPNIAATNSNQLKVELKAKSVAGMCTE